MAKLIVLYKRRAGSAVEEFQQDLLRRTQRPAGLAGLQRYVQSHTLAQGYRKGELLYDAVAEYVFGDIAQARAARDAVRAAPPPSALVDPAQTVDMLVDVYVMKATPVPPKALKSIEFVNRKPAMPLDAFGAHWRIVHGPLGASIKSVLRYEQNHLHRSCYAEGAEPRFDGVATTWFTSTDAMRSGVGTPEYEATRRDEPNFLAEGHLPVIITREAIDWAF
jgi:uncharacterized protein (TIGR02118 family)